MYQFHVSWNVVTGCGTVYLFKFWFLSLFLFLFLSFLFYFQVNFIGVLLLLCSVWIDFFV